MLTHPGIRIDKIPVRGLPGLAFTIGILSVFLIGVPATRLFFLINLSLGTLFAGWLYFWHNQTRW